MKTKLILLFIAISSIALAQNIPCEKIERTTVSMRSGKNGETKEKNAFKVGMNEPKFFGVFYKNLKPYIWCTQEAVPEFNKAVMFSKLKTGCFLAACAASFVAGAMMSSASSPSGTGETPMGPLVATSPLFVGTIPLYVLQRKHIRKSIEKHNLSLH